MYKLIYQPIAYLLFLLVALVFLVLIGRVHGQMPPQPPPQAESSPFSSRPAPLAPSPMTLDDNWNTAYWQKWGNVTTILPGLNMQDPTGLRSAPREAPPLRMPSLDPHQERRWDGARGERR